MRYRGNQDRQWWISHKGRKLLVSIVFWLRQLWIEVDFEVDQWISQKLNDSLYSWYEPNDSELEIVFFHGLVPTPCGDIHRRAWTNHRGECWPEEWLQAEQGFPRARILSVKYDSSLHKRKSVGVYAWKLLAETLATDLIELGNIGQTGQPVVLVGHDLGGIVIKSLCVHVQTSIALDTRDISEERRRKFERFLNNVREVFYFSTPHHGLFSSISEFDGELAECLRIFNTQTARLNNDFWKLRESRKWGTAGVGSLVEDKEVSGCSAEATNRYDTDKFMMLPERRETINKPDSPLSSSFQLFVDSVKDFIQCHRMEDVDERFQEFIRQNVGLEDSVQQVTSLLASLERAEGGINAVVLHGMGGIGKSTLGDAVFLKLSRKFDPDCRLWLDREANPIFTPPLSDLQLSIIKRLSSQPEPISGRKQIREKLRECYKRADRPLLIFIDNIENEEELEEIFPGNISDLLPRQSYILIASRNLGMCTRLGTHGQPYPHPDCSRLHRVVPKVCLYRVKVLDEHSAEKLFWQCAMMEQLSEIQRGQVRKDVQKVLDVCCGLPLALKVVGAALTATQLSNWSDVVQRLADCIPVDGTREDTLNRSLEFSYSQLHEKTQQAFLDIVFCFNGSPWNQLKVMYGDKLNILEQRALIMKEDRVEYGSSFSYSTVKVHALFVALGKREGTASGSHISLEGERYVRLQDIDLKSGKDGSVVLVLQGSLPRFGYVNNETKARCLELIKKKKTRRQGVLSESEGFSRSLRLLVLRDLLIQGTFHMDEVPENLECLVCFNSNLPFLNGNLTSLRKLKYLDILTRVDDEQTYAFPEGVEHLRLENRALKAFTFGSTHNDSASHSLKEFGLMSAANLVVNIRIEQFQSLSKLVLTNITGLDNNLPDKLFRLKSLQSLSIQNCQHISTLPDFHTQRLKHLHLALPDLIELPDTLKSLKSLRSLYLDRCFKLKQLPHDPDSLFSSILELIALDGCKNLDLPLLWMVEEHTMMPSGVLELQVSNFSKWQYYTRKKLDRVFLEESSAAIQMPPLVSQGRGEYVGGGIPQPIISSHIWLWRGLSLIALSCVHDSCEYYIQRNGRTSQVHNIIRRDCVLLWIQSVDTTHLACFRASSFVLQANKAISPKVMNHLLS